MHARMSILEGSPDQTDEGLRHVREQVLPQLQQMDGFEEFIVLSDRQGGKLLGVTIWENEELMQPLEKVLSRTRGGISHPLGGAIVGVDTYAVSISGLSS